MNRGPRWRAVGLLAVLVLTACGGDPAPTDPEPSGDRTAVAYGVFDCPALPATDAAVEGSLPLATYPCLTGDGELTLGGVVGRPMVLNLWASWCGPCREELPIFQQLAFAAGDRLIVMGLVERDGEAAARAFAGEVGISFPSAIDDTGRLLAELGRNALPITYFVNADGTVAHEQLVPVTSLDELTDLVAEHLGVQVP